MENGNLGGVEGIKALGRVHLIGICGVGMGSLAMMLQALGLEVTGSDEGCFPPMSLRLAEAGIRVMEGYRADHLDPAPGLVVVGNVCRRENPEAAEARRRGLLALSLPDLLGQVFVAGRHSLVVAGTHGKTTTSSLAAWALEAAGRRPGFFIGAVPLNFGVGARAAGGDVFVLEGDEYDTAYFDKRPKFMHYRPRTAILTSVEFDHGDIYADLAAVTRAFEALAGLLPPEGKMIVNRASPGAMAVAARAGCEVMTYGLGVEADLVATDLSFDGRGALFTAGGQRYILPMWGNHNVENALAVVAALRGLGVAPERIAGGLASYRGVKRRQEIRGVVGGITVVDDFAHHPTAVRETLRSMRQRFGQARLWALFEPRTNTSRRRVFQQEYALAFDLADRVLVAPTYLAQSLGPQEAFSPAELVASLGQRGVEAGEGASIEAMVDQVISEAREGDIVIAMSNGSFGQICSRLLEGLRARSGAEGGGLDRAF